MVIVSSDKDMMQLIRPGVTMFDPMKSKPIGVPEVFEKFGVTPDKVVDIQSLAGDSTDNVPGVPGIGVKTAAQLITEYGDLDTLLARAGEIKQPKRRESLIQFAEQARISRQLVLLDAHAPVPVPVEDLKVHEPDPDRLIAFLTQQEFRTTLARVQSRLREAGELVEHEHVGDAPVLGARNHHQLRAGDRYRRPRSVAHPRGDDRAASLRRPYRYRAARSLPGGGHRHGRGAGRGLLRAAGP